MRESLVPGLVVDFSCKSSEEMTVPHLLPQSPEFQQMPRVLATGYMVGLFEWACIKALNPHLDWPREQTVGIGVDFSHVAATPPGLTIRITGELKKVDGRKLTFSLSGHDGVKMIGRGIHKRFVIDAEKFNANADRKGAPD